MSRQCHYSDSWGLLSCLKLDMSICPAELQAVSQKLGWNEHLDANGPSHPLWRSSWHMVSWTPQRSRSSTLILVYSPQVKGADINSHEKGNSLARRYRTCTGIKTEDLTVRPLRKQVSWAGLVGTSFGKRHWEVVWKCEVQIMML